VSRPAVLELRALRKAYGPVLALEQLDLTVSSGECVALIGHNGSGKTTALRLASGQLQPTAGTVRVAGLDVHRDPRDPRARARVAFVPDSPVLYGDLTVAEHLQLVALAHGLGAAAGARAAALLEQLGLADRADFLPPWLSHGMRQKVQLACALLRPFSVLLLDEPVVGLDPPSQAALQAQLRRCKRRGAALLLSTHQLPWVADLADRAVILSDGRVVDQGPYHQVVAGDTATRLGLR
jgi:ABC-2 type transport system ATP-binding protein